MKKKINFSVVCATHKGAIKLNRLILSFYEGTTWPKEIIICGTTPKDLIHVKKKILSKLNVKFILSKKKNQVYQRALAVKKSKEDFILQIDDDVTVYPNFVKNLEKYVHKNQKYSKWIISALIIQKNGSLQAGSWNAIYRKFFLFRSIIYILNKGKKIEEYSVLHSGRCVPYIKNFGKKLKSNIISTEWLCSTVFYPRSCLKFVKKIKQKANKAYYEDVFFSHQLYKKGYNLMIDKDVVGVHDNQPYTSISTYFKTLGTQYELVNFFKKSKILFVLDVIIFTFVHLLRDIYLITTGRNNEN